MRYTARTGCSEFRLRHDSGHVVDWSRSYRSITRREQSTMPVPLLPVAVECESESERKIVRVPVFDCATEISIDRIPYS